MEYPNRTIRIEDNVFEEMKAEKNKRKYTWNQYFRFLVYGKDDVEEKEFNLKAEVEKLSESKQKHIRIIGWYMTQKGVYLPSKKTLSAEIRRWVKDASLLADYPDEDVLKACNIAKREYPDIWNLSTIKKVIVNL